MNEYNNPSLATMFQSALLNTCMFVLIHCYMRNKKGSRHVT
jgi:hypothetical protein